MNRRSLPVARAVFLCLLLVTAPLAAIVFAARGAAAPTLASAPR